MPRALVESTLTPLCFSFSSSFFLSGHAVHPISLLVTMPKKKQLTPAQIEVIHALYKEGTATRCIAENMGISVRTVQVWTKKIRDAGEGTLPTHKKRPGKKRLLSNRTLNAAFIFVPPAAHISSASTVYIYTYIHTYSRNPI